MKSTTNQLAVAACILLCMHRVSSFTPSTNRKTPAKDTSTQRNFIEEARKNVFGTVDEHRLKDHQQKAIPVASSFIPSQYNPHPFLTNQHLQTILGVFIRDAPGVAYMKDSGNIIDQLAPVGKAIIDVLPRVLGMEPVDKACDYWDKREKFDTPDGDFFHVDYKFQNPKIEGGGEGMVIIIHGLESNSNSTLCQNMSRAYAEKNMDVACINFRGCSGNPNETVLQYHAGFTDDIITFLDEWTKRQSNEEEEEKKPLYVSGFSLGANVVMKLLGDLGMDAVDKYNIRAGAVANCPFSLEYHWNQLIDFDFQRIVYAGSLLKTMKKKVEYITENFLDGDKDTDVIDYWKCMNATTIAEIEDGMIAPLYGFKDRFDYYKQTASLPVVDRIAVPTIVMNAADDPFFNSEFFPWEKDCEIGGIAPVKLVRSDHGGHLGHLFHRVKGDNTRAAVSSFVPMELARFLDHVHVRSN